LTLHKPLIIKGLRGLGRCKSLICRVLRERVNLKSLSTKKGEGAEAPSL